MPTPPADSFDEALQRICSWLEKQSWYRNESYYGLLPTESASAPRGYVLQTSRQLTPEEEREVRDRFGDVPIKFLHTSPTMAFSLPQQ